MAKTGIVPIVDADRRFNLWQMNDIYTDEPNSTGRYVPNVGDLVVGYDTGWWRCTHSDLQTGYSTLVAWSFNTIIDNTGDAVDSVISGSSTTNDTYRMYVNTKKVPYEFSIDTRLKIYGSAPSYIKIFKDGKTEGTSISATFNSVGEIVTENIQLENVIIPNTTVQAIKVPKQGKLTDKVEHGEVVNVVVYSNSGSVLAIFKVVAVSTNFVRTIDAGKKLITNITMVSPYLSANDDRLIEYPSNMTLDSSSLVGRVTYNDGTTQRYPVDGRKFKLLGLDNYITSQSGQTVPLVLTYTLAADEFANNVQEVAGNRFITKSYQLTTVESDNLYSVKLFVVPFWTAQDNTWRLDYYLYSLDRDKIYKVTQYVEHASNALPFVGGVDKWGVAQPLTVSINLDKLGASFKYYRHVQDFTVTIHQAGSNPITSGYYTLEYDADSIVGQVSTANVTTVSGISTIDFGNQRNDIAHWIDAAYTATEPLYFPFAEENAPKPTHVKILIGENWSREIPIADVLKPVTNVNTPVVQGSTIRLEFIANYNSKRLQLSTIGLIAKLI